MPDEYDDEYDDESSPFRVVDGETTTGLKCDRCSLPTAWSGNLYLLFGDNAPRFVKTVTGCICCDAPIKEPGHA